MKETEIWIGKANYLLAHFPPKIILAYHELNLIKSMDRFVDKKASLNPIIIQLV